MKRFIVLLCIFFVPALVSAQIGPLPTTPENALTLLMEGNARFASGHAKHLNSSPSQRLLTISRYTPLATILAVSDARMPVSRVFDRGIGDLVVAEVPNILEAQTAFSCAEKSLAAMPTPVVMILAPWSPLDDEVAIEDMERLVWKGMEELLQAHTVRQAVEGGRMWIVGGVYNILTGKIGLLGVEEQSASELQKGEAVPGQAGAEETQQQVQEQTKTSVVESKTISGNAEKLEHSANTETKFVLIQKAEEDMQFETVQIEELRGKEGSLENAHGQIAGHGAKKKDSGGISFFSVLLFLCLLIGVIYFLDTKVLNTKNDW